MSRSLLPRSIRHRFGVRWRSTAAAVLVVAVALCVIGVAVLVVLRAALVGTVDEAVTQRGADVVAQIQSDDVEAALPTVGASSDDATLLQVVSASGEVLLASPILTGAPPLTNARPTPGQSVTQDVTLTIEDPELYRVVSQGADSTAGPVVVITAQSLSDLTPVYRTVGLLLLVAAPFLLAAVAASTWFAVGRSLRAVDRIRLRVEGIGETGPDQRVPVPEAHDEVARLAVTMNQMLSRLEDSSAARRRFVADASHELRSPLTSLRASLEVAGAGGTLADWQDAQAVMTDEVDRMGGLVADLLLLARADEGALQPHPVEVDLDDLVMAECRRLRAQTSLQVMGVVTPVKVVADSDELGRSLRNMADNAARHARTRVRITIGADTDHVVVEVADDGPGIPADQRERVMERFVRLDPGRSRQAGGSGLGLSIVAEIARVHGGSVQIGQSDLGGASVRLLLPR